MKLTVLGYVLSMTGLYLCSIELVLLGGFFLIEKGMRSEY